MTKLESLLAELAKTTLECLEQDSQPKNEQKIFEVKFTSDVDGNVNVQVAWPTNVPIENKIIIMSTLMMQINSGAWKEALIRGIQSYGIANNEADISQAILQQWDGSSTICVDPVKVFKYNDDINSV